METGQSIDLLWAKLLIDRHGTTVNYISYGHMYDTTTRRRRYDYDTRRLRRYDEDTISLRVSHECRAIKEG